MSLNGLAAGRYFLNVYGFEGATNPSYSLEINPASQRTGSTGGTDDASAAYRTLYLNFDGVQLSHQDLVRYSQGFWHPESDYLQQSQVTVNAFRPGDANRDSMIADIMGRLQQDLTAYGITVQRITGGAVEGYGATTVFVGATNLLPIQQGRAAGVASSVDRGNDNPTDIGIVTDNIPAGSYEEYVLNATDLILHEAGHTWGLYHVNTNLNGSVYGESMGFTYTVQHYNLQLQTPDTGFLDVTFYEFVDQQGQEHGLQPGVLERQNSHQVMLAAFTRPEPAVYSRRTIWPSRM